MKYKTMDEELLNSRIIALNAVLATSDPGTATYMEALELHARNCKVENPAQAIKSAVKAYAADKTLSVEVNSQQKASDILEILKSYSCFEPGLLIAFGNLPIRKPNTSLTAKKLGYNSFEDDDKRYYRTT